jgi:hypothetical protein
MNPEGSSSNNDLKKLESLSISPEVFEKLYLSPENAVKGDLRKTFGNPTPLFVPISLLHAAQTDNSQSTRRFRRCALAVIYRIDGLERRNRSERNHACEDLPPSGNER